MRRMLPAIFRSRIFRQSASAFRIGQFSIFVEKLRKNRYSFSVTDIRRAIVLFIFVLLALDGINFKLLSVRLLHALIYPAL